MRLKGLWSVIFWQYVIYSVEKRADFSVGALFVFPLYGIVALHPNIILASSSPFRKELLERLHLDFECHSPEIDESTIDGESPANYVCRLAQSKGQKLATQFPDSIVIGSDQCAVLDGEILGKPGDHSNALKQLKKAQGKTVVFHTAVCVINLISHFKMFENVLFEVDFRQLEDEQLDNYLRMEEPYQCAGSFKSEGYGASLCRAMRGSDPTALIGLPLLTLIPMLESAGIDVV